MLLETLQTQLAAIAEDALDSQAKKFVEQLDWRMTRLESFKQVACGDRIAAVQNSIQGLEIIRRYVIAIFTAKELPIQRQMDALTQAELCYREVEQDKPVMWYRLAGPFSGWLPTL